MTLHVEIKNYLKFCVDELRVAKDPYLKKLCSGDMSKEQFLRSQLEFSPIIFFFSRPLIRIIANNPKVTARIALVDNLWEKHEKGVMENVHL